MLYRIKRGWCMESREVVSVLCVSLSFFSYIDLPPGLTPPIKTIKKQWGGLDNCREVRIFIY